MSETEPKKRGFFSRLFGLEDEQLLEDLDRVGAIFWIIFCRVRHGVPPLQVIRKIPCFYTGI